MIISINSYRKFRVINLMTIQIILIDSLKYFWVRNRKILLQPIFQGEQITNGFQSNITVKNQIYLK
ncbi:unnamed protein product [Paramecium sonneborni]|uniref:Uncharacterized protein n=1 Tax=Paramecium sonneborni TaxID=65129 RepID=A0A8S1M6K0_9CILI|nr:unnamed protein product [Paramecium sonneborni]